MIPFWLGVGGTWVPLEHVSVGAAVEATRPSSESVSLGGVVRRQSARAAARSWSLDFKVKTSEFVRYLALAAQGLVGDVFLYDAAAAQVNMLDPRDCVGRDVSQPTILVGLVPLRTFAAGYTLTTKLRAGVQYHLSGTTSHTAAATLGTYNIGAGAVNIVAPAGTGPRRWSTSFMPLTAATVTIILTVAGVVTALRLTEGSVDSLGFLPGQKAVCQVSVSDPQQVLNMVFSDRLPLSDWSVTLREVG